MVLMGWMLDLATNIHTFYKNHFYVFRGPKLGTQNGNSELIFARSLILLYSIVANSLVYRLVRK